MGDTSGNTNLAIATNGSSHVATTMGPTDVCKLPNGTPAPFPNFIKAQGNLLDGTTMTSIQSQPVWIQKSKLGPVSQPPHAGVAKGVCSGTYCDVAKATSWSKDVQKEGQYIVRTGDSTTQNKANTVGVVAGSPLAAKAAADDEYKKKMCTIVKLVGKCGHGRELGPKPGSKPGAESNYLEILKGDFVDFEATRENAVDAGQKPKCTPGIHTEWYARVLSKSWWDQTVDTAKHAAVQGLKGAGSGAVSGALGAAGGGPNAMLAGALSGAGQGGKAGVVSGVKDGLNGKLPATEAAQQRAQAGLLEKGAGAVGATGVESWMAERREKAGDKFHLGDKLTGESNPDVTKKMGATGQTVGNFADREVLQQPASGTVAADKVGSGPVGANTALGDAKKTQEAAKPGAIPWGTIKDAILMWDATVHPRRVSVEAMACSGKKAAEILVLPSHTVTVQLFNESVKAKVQKIKEALKLVELAASAFKQPARITFLENPSLAIKIAYKELKQDKPARKVLKVFDVGPHYKVQCRRNWTLEASLKPVVGGYLKFTTPILNALGVVGAAIAWVIKLVGAEGNFFLKVELNLEVTGKISWDEYDEVDASITPEMVLTFSAGAEIYVRVAEVTLYGYIEGKISFEKWEPRPGFLLTCEAKGAVQAGVKGSAKANWWGKTYSYEVDWKPSWLKYEAENGVRIPVLAAPGAAPLVVF